ncbi:MAG: LPS export ABC transporter periplasmic protein LptC [Balneolaceae bacterium]
MARCKALPVLLLPLLFAACMELSEFDAQQVQSALNDSLTTTTESWDVRMQLMQQQRREISIEGSYAITYQRPDRRETRISGPVYVQLFDTAGNVKTEAWSKRAVYLEQERAFELFDSVRVLTAENRRLYSEFLVWTQDDDRIHSPEFVTIITPSDSIAGLGFDGTTDLSSYIIERPTGRFTVD